jgi:hypothetical protein
MRRKTTPGITTSTTDLGSTTQKAGRRESTYLSIFPAHTLGHHKGSRLSRSALLRRGSNPTSSIAFYCLEGKSEQVSEAFVIFRKTKNFVLCDLGILCSRGHWHVVHMSHVRIFRHSEPFYDLVPPPLALSLRCLYCLAMIPPGVALGGCRVLLWRLGGMSLLSWST